MVWIFIGMQSTKNRSLTEIYLQAIRTAYPDWEVADSKCEFNSSGQYNDILTIDHQYIFRFPKYPEALQQLKVETLLLNTIKPYLSLEIPSPLFENLIGAQVGEAFIGYRKIRGEPLWRDTLNAIQDERILDSLARQLGVFLKELHSIPLSAIKCELPRLDTSEEAKDIYTRICEKLFLFMRPDARQWTRDHFESFLISRSNFEYTPVLKHGDFGPSNILFDPHIQTITGVIDFGGAGIGDPAYDFAGLLSGYGDDFLQRCAKFYPKVISFLDRIYFYRGTFALLEALFGIENNDLEAFEDGIGMYR